MVRLLHDPEKFGGAWLLPSVTRDDPAFADNVYWRGRIWPPLVFLTWEGLRRAGYRDEAAELARRGWALFAEQWSERRRCRENYKIDPAADPEVSDSDGFYTWGALLALMPLLERGDASPWSGLTLAPGGEVSFGGVSWAMREDGTIERAGEAVLKLSTPVTVRELEIGETVTFSADTAVSSERV
jgi:putative isomerase